MTSVEVLLPNHLPHGFDYAVPPGMVLAPGDYVRVPFGSRAMTGLVWGPGDPARAGRLKAVTTHHAHLPPVGEPMRRFIEWVAWYSCAPRGAVLKMVLPVEQATLPPSGRERAFIPDAACAMESAVLSGMQAAAAQALAVKLHAGFSVTLLDGVTGSGKTEVYFDAIARVIAQGGQALVLLPEISLSVQWLERFKQRFGFAPVTWHSGVPVGARKAAWRGVAHGEARVVVGARSALFLPYRNLQLIVADEEHDGSYKQEDGVVYHARDMAVARARFEKIPVVLASATPSLETFRNVQAGKYASLVLPARHGGAALPEIKMIDMRSAELERGSFLARELREALAANVALGHQSMLFLNRRGYAPLVLCRACGHRFQCPQCTSWLVLHKTRPRLECHHCGYNIPEPKTCPMCQAQESLFPCGPGVERIAEEVAGFLPQARVEVLASDSADSYAELQARIHAMQSGGIDILIGTQMMAKGHHFERLALVGVVDADLGLAGGDLRAAERTWQLLHQISGRAGRAKTAGRVLVQSFCPGHPVMQALLSNDREAFMQMEMAERERGRMPPFARLAAIVIDSPQEDLAARTARDLARLAPPMEGVQFLGPAPAPLFMLRGRYRQRLLLRTPRNVDIQAVLSQWMSGWKPPSGVRVKVDVDPYSFL